MHESGNIKSMSLELTKPLNMSFDMDYQKLCLIVGMNGAGKTLILKLNWCISTFVAMALIAPERIWKEAFQYIMDKSFDNQDFTGKFGAVYEFVTASFEMKNGKVMKAEITTKGEISSFPKAIFMSKETRTFEQLMRYVKTKKALNVKGSLFTVVDESFNPVLNLYKLYDVVFMENALKKLSEGIVISDQLKKSLSDMGIQKKVSKIYYDPKKEDIFYVEEDGKSKSALTLSAGEQSVLNMFTAL